MAYNACDGCGNVFEECERHPECDVARACIECDRVYVGQLTCPACASPGEPLDLSTPYTLESAADFFCESRDSEFLAATQPSLPLAGVSPNCS
jgi:hypothetical protein